MEPRSETSRQANWCESEVTVDQGEDNNVGVGTVRQYQLRQLSRDYKIST